MRRSSFILFIIFCLLSKSYALTCRDVNNKPVDWFIIYKLPALKHSPNNLVRNGVGQVYMDSNNANFKLLDVSIAEQKGPVYYSLANIYSSKSIPTMYAMYNDQTLYETFESYGHTKGVLNFDKTSGFWMIHSIPKFPSSPQNKYLYPETGTKFGQTLLCVTFNYSFLDQLGVQLRFNNPKIYNYSLPADMGKSNPNLALALNGSSISDRPYFSVVELKSLQGEKFLSFAKNAHFNQDLYSNLVATRLQSSLLVEAWRNGKGDMDSECNLAYKVENIESIKLLENSFNSTSDHSKWAVTTSLLNFKRNRNRNHLIDMSYKMWKYQEANKQKYVVKMSMNRKSSLTPSSGTSTWTCIGDINRQEHQLKRGGGTMCVSLLGVWKNFKQMVTTVEQC